MADHQIVSLAQARAQDIPLRARVRFRQFGMTLAGRVVGISHDAPMRYDLRLDNGALVANVPEPEIDAVVDPSTATPGPEIAALRREPGPGLAGPRRRLPWLRPAGSQPAQEEHLVRRAIGSG